VAGVNGPIATLLVDKEGKTELVFAMISCKRQAQSAQDPAMSSGFAMTFAKEVFTLHHPGELFNLKNLLGFGLKSQSSHRRIFVVPRKGHI